MTTRLPTGKLERLEDLKELLEWAKKEKIIGCSHISNEQVVDVIDDVKFEIWAAKKEAENAEEE